MSCLVCDTPIAYTFGRPRRFCSDDCKTEMKRRQRAYRRLEAEAAEYERLAHEWRNMNRGPEMVRHAAFAKDQLAAYAALVPEDYR